MEQIKDCDGLMWQWSHTDYRAQNFARQLIFSAEKMGLKVFPSFDTCWHYDDKVGQKYLLEAVNAPLISSFVFYEKNEALNWIINLNYPIVFKLRGGAGSSNVKLIQNKRIAKKYIRKSFGSGFNLVSKLSNIKQRFWVVKRDKNIYSIINFVKGLVRIVTPKGDSNLLPLQKGYFYVQYFIPNNDFDDRVVIIGGRAIAIRRYNRKGDFRASGSGLIMHNSDLFDVKIIKTAFNVTERIGAQSLAFDFVYDDAGNPYIIEISYTYAMGAAYDNCPGYWDKDLNWHNDDVDPQRYIIEDFLNDLI